jgi:predicted site-specific integrase-resolvase
MTLSDDTASSSIIPSLESTLCGVHGIDSVMQQFDSGNQSVAHTSRSLASNRESIVASRSMTKAALYARVSSERQKQEQTIESQVVELKRQIVAAGHVLVKEYIDDGYSGAEMDRPGLEQLRKELKGDF